MGWAPKDSVPGDVVTVLTGGRVPIILRPHNYYYTVIGEACVHDLMGGEAMWSVDDLEYLEYLELR